MKVFISTSSFGTYDDTPLKKLSAAKMAWTLNPHGRKLTEAEIEAFLREGKYDGLVAGVEPLTQSVLRNATSLKVISRVGVGLDNVDLVAAKKLKIKVFNTPLVLIDAVAELALGLTLSVLRKIPLADRKIRGRLWKKNMGALLKGKTLGIVGYGHIGQRVAELASAFGVKVVFTDLKTVRAKNRKDKKVSFEQLLKMSDVISFHCSSSQALITDRQVAKMKKGVVLINTARGALIEEAALIDGLNSGKIAGAGLDVFAEEPYSGDLIARDDVVLTPHVGSYAKEARVAMENEAVANLLKGMGKTGKRKKA